MLAGATGIEAVMLVIASDESVKPQTREHFDICRLLNVRHGVIVLTKCDLATKDQIALAEEAARKLCSGSFLQDAPVVRVSALTGYGLPELRDRLSSLARARTAIQRNGVVRLPIDRSFAMKGFGTVVTGTLWGGSLQTGQTVEIQPLARQARIRGLQVHGQSVDRAEAGQRTAVNITGIEHSELRRGFVLGAPGVLESSLLLDTEVEWLQGTNVPNRRDRFLLYLGTAEVPASLKIVELMPGARTLARLWLSQPTVALPGDRFVLRHASSARTVAGGSIVDAFPPKRLSRTKIAQRSGALRDADVASRVEILVAESKAGRKITELARMTGLASDEVKRIIMANPALLLLPGPQRVVTKEWKELRREKLLDWLRAFHAKYPSAPGAPIAAARSGLDPGVAAELFADFPAIRLQGDTIALATHEPSFSEQDMTVLSKIEQLYRKAGFQPPSIAEALNSAGLTKSGKARELLETLIKNKRLIRLPGDLVFHADVIAHIQQSLAAHKGRRFSVPEFKEWTHVSRKYAIPLLEYLDHQRITRREGDLRVVL